MTIAELLTPEEVGRLLRVSDQTVIAMCKRKELQHAQIGKQYRVYAQQLADKLGWPRNKLAVELGRAEA